MKIPSAHTPENAPAPSTAPNSRRFRRLLCVAACFGLVAFAQTSALSFQPNPSGLNQLPHPVKLVIAQVPAPEMSGIYPIVGLLSAIGFTHLLRRRRMAQLALAESEE